MMVPLLLAAMTEAEGRVAVSAALSQVPPAMPVVSLPLHINGRVEGWMDRFRGDEWPGFKRLLERKGAYEGLIVGELRKRGMPEELVYLAMMEGGFSPSAVSRASAVGLWQFMGPTAKQYGLRIDEWVDERKDPVRATDAALDYLTWLHDRYGSWYLAAAAYNAGPTRLDRILRLHAQGRTGDEGLYWEVLDHLPPETRHYVPRIVAATLIGRDASLEASGMSAADPYRYDIVFVPGGTPLIRIARAIGVDEEALTALNPHLVLGVSPPGEAGEVRVPTGTTPAVVASLARRPQIPAAPVLLQ
jgi:membrane-bound lytic murein transglycosylase D